MKFRRIRAIFLFIIIIFLSLQTFKVIGGISGRNKVIVIDPGHGGIDSGADNKGIVEREDLLVLNQTNMPAIIVECGFLSNSKEANLLLTDEYQDNIVDGLGKYFNY